MKKVIKFSIVLAMIIATTSLVGCQDDNGGGGGGSTAKLSPPEWIQGAWGYEEVELAIRIEVFKFTSNDVLVMGVSLKDIWNVNVPGAVKYSLKETKNTSSLYEITISASAGGESASGYYSFRKGDGTYIDAASNETGTPLTDADYEKLDKLN